MEPITLTGSSTTTKRRELDFYPTPPEVTEALMGFLNLKRSRIWEPACGDGAMSRVLESYGHTVVSSDIVDSPAADLVCDFLSETSVLAEAIITNPPFNLAEQFIRHALRNAPIVAMLLKSQYWHAKSRTSLFNEHPPAWVLPLNWRPDFRNGELGGSPTMEVAWSVWLPGQTDTRYRVLAKPNLGYGLI